MKLSKRFPWAPPSFDAVGLGLPGGPCGTVENGSSFRAAVRPGARGAARRIARGRPHFTIDLRPELTAVASIVVRNVRAPESLLAEAAA